VDVAAGYLVVMYVASCIDFMMILLFLLVYVPPRTEFIV